LFYGEDDERDGENPVNVLEGRRDLFFWDPSDGSVGVSNIFKGRRSVDLSDFILADTLKVNFGDVPLSSVKVDISCEWVQRANGDFDLLPRVAGAFPGGIVNTLTPKALMKNWPKDGDKVGPTKMNRNSGYMVMASKIERVTPPSTGVLNTYPTLTKEIWGRRLSRAWFDGRLSVYWRYTQKRTEVVRFTLHHDMGHDFRFKGMIKGREKTLRLCLQNVQGYLNGPDASSFFQMERGKQAILHGVEIAKSHLAGSARCLEVEFQVPLEAALGVGLDHNVVLSVKGLPKTFGERIVGKVARYRFDVTYDRQVAWLKVLAVPGGDVADDLVDVVTLGYFKDQVTTKGLVKPSSMGVNDFVEDVCVRMDAVKQAESLEEAVLSEGACDFDDKSRACFINNFLRKNPTAIGLKMLDLRSVDNLVHIIDVPLSGKWKWSQD